MDSDLYIYPGITKNLTKTMCGKLKRFIKKQFKEQQEVLEDSNVKEFLKATQDYKVVNLNQLKQSKIGKEIVNFFFGNLIWCLDINELNKLDINYYFQFNHIWYNENPDENQQKEENTKQTNENELQYNQDGQIIQQAKYTKEENQDEQFYDFVEKKQKLE